MDLAPMKAVAGIAIGCRKQAVTPRARISFLLAVAAALVLLAPGPARAAIPFEASLSASPSSVSWPEETKFQYRLDVTAGDQGLDATLELPPSPWGIDGLDGSPFSVGRARLEGPGSIKVIPIAVPMILDRTACYRGSRQFPSLYRLVLGPGEKTTVVADARLEAASLPGLRGEILASIQPKSGGSGERLAAPLTIGGRQGALIKTRFTGNGEARIIQLTPASKFRLTGATEPALPRRMIAIEATRVVPPLARQKARLITVQTDDEGRFQTGKLSLRSAGTWQLNTALVDPGELDGQPHCAGVVDVRHRERRATAAALLGHTFVSTSVWGRNMKNRRIRLRFFRHAEIPGRPKRPTMVAHAGCDYLGARFRVRSSRLRWTGRINGTQISCRTNHDRWLTHLLRRGLRAKLYGDQLVLTRRNTEIVLRRVR